MPSAIRLALEKAGYIDQDGRIKDMQETDGSPTRKYSISEEKSSDIRYSIDDTPETPDVSDSAFDEALRRAGLSHLVEDAAESGDTETAPPPRKAPRERDPKEDRLDRIRAHETLANALMEAAQNEHEFRLVKNYRQKAAELADAERKLTEIEGRTDDESLQ